MDILNLFDPSLGYLALLTVSFIGSVIPFIPVPFFILLIVMSADPTFNPHILVFMTAIGSTAGKAIIFYATYYGRNRLSAESKKRIRPLQRVAARYGWFAAFIAAATPIPDDLVYIPLGLAKYNPILFILSTLTGKAVISEVIVWSSKLGLSPYLQPLLENKDSLLSIYISAIVLAIIIGLILYYMPKIDWEKYIGKLFPWAINDEDDKE